MSAMLLDMSNKPAEESLATIDEVIAFPYRDLQWRSRSDPQVRILHILPASGSGDDVVCRLTAVYTGDQPSYEALSYTWGDSDHTRTITLNGHAYQVTSNLYSALQHLRHADKERRIWVDAVCINQSDLEEKNLMVQQMHLIYHRADLTLVWLGERSRDSDLALDLVCLQGQNGELCIDPAIESELEQKLLAEKDVTEESRERWEALAGLFGRPYWTRVWIVQELVWSYYITVVCGERQMPFNCFRLAHFTIWGIFDRSRPLLTSLSGSIFVGLRGMRTIGHIVQIHNCLFEPSRPLGSILSYLRRCKATDPRDKVYGCITLAELPLPKGLEVRYNLSPAEAYTNAARALIEHDKSLKILSSCEDHDLDQDVPEYLTSIDGCQRHNIPELPSWAPNWGRPRLGVPLPGDYEVLSLVSEIFREDPYFASGASKPYYKFLDDQMSLVVRGFVLDGVVEVGSDFYGIGGHRDFLLDAVNSCSRWPVAGVRYGSGLVDSLIHTMTGNRHGGGTKFPRGFIPNLENSEDPEVQDNIARTTSGRVFLISSQGLLGLGPRNTQVNDRLCIIAGCHVPVVLRQVRRAGGHDGDGCITVTHEETAYYHVVGGAYVHGVMEGELASRFNKAELTEFVLR
ncbi:hypothetical protein W97_07195 [Coniosporium apollinis CBS 100218]|uniref:Heterokaryon incompatibility domain-containing protein n=1 Tax=Coniosporium apollinis (strain CBS 100218) TaxID=1168221 RepID=R7Z1L8_CONA1|nr:uncharacterized protein W97_07195 [Coniosporium apollinis CBS 100218]EON68047.1 hypothetical protein W97_07195 [Coniosporium apollinis CBS 100218]